MKDLTLDATVELGKAIAINGNDCKIVVTGDFAAFNEVYAKYFVSKPARSCVAVKDLPKGVLCKIEALAVK